MAVLRPLPAVAHFLHRHPNLLHTWWRTGRLTAACDITTRTVLIDFPEAARISAATHRRRPRPLTPTRR